MPLRAARYRRAALAALGAGCVLALTGCALMEGASLTPVPPETTASANAADAPLFFEESISGGVMGNPFFGRGEMSRITTGDTEGLVRIRQPQFHRPVAVAAKDQWIYVVDAGLQAVLVYDRFTRHLEPLADLHGMTGPEVADIFVTGDRSFYLADRYGAKVLKFSRDGRLELTIQDTMNLRQPVAVAVDETTGDIYVADGVMDHVLVFNSAGMLWRAIGGRGEGEGQFLNITGMALGPDGLYVTARLAHRAQVMSLEGQFKYAFELDTLVFPNSAAVDASNRIYITDFIDNKIKIFEQGKLVTDFGGTGVSPGRFKGISDVWVDGGTLYVADSLNGRIQVFRLAGSVSSK